MLLVEDSVFAHGGPGLGKGLRLWVLAGRSFGGEMRLVRDLCNSFGIVFPSVENFAWGWFSVAKLLSPSKYVGASTWPWTFP